MMLAFPLLLVLTAPAGTCVPVQAERIYGRDVASALPAFSAVPSELPLAYAPVPGVRRVLTGEWLKRFAKTHGLQLASAPDLCFEVPLVALRPDALRAAVRTSLREAGFEPPSLQIEIVRWGPPAVPSGPVVFTLAGIHRPADGNPQSEVMLRGYVAYGENHRFSLWISARLHATATCVVAASALSPGKPIREDQVRLESRELFALDTRPARRLDEVLGSLPRGFIAPGALIWRGHVSRVPEVARGDLVKVEVTAGAARLWLEGRAQTSGSTGVEVWVKNPAGGKAFRGIITGKGRVTVGASPGPESELASEPERLSP